jgi:ribose transport system permease protein
MSSAPAAVNEPRTSAAQTVMRTFRDRPVVPLLVLLGILALAFIGLNPRTNITEWVASTLRAAIPLAILAGCQTIVMLTGGIDLSVAATASMSAFVAASLLEQQGLAVAIIVPLVIAVIIGVINGIGSGVFRVHPLIMTLGMGLVVFGASNAWQLLTVKTSSGVPPEIRQIGSATVLGFVPVSLVVFVPLALIIVIGLRRTGYGRLLYAIGDNPIAARLSGARSWQVLVVLYAISAVLAAIAGYLISGFTNVASVTLADSYLLPSVAAAVIGGTSIFGGRGGYTGTIVGALILTVATSLLFSLGFPEAVRQILFGLLIVLVAAGYARVTGET